MVEAPSDLIHGIFKDRPLDELSKESGLTVEDVEVVCQSPLVRLAVRLQVSGEEE